MNFDKHREGLKKALISRAVQDGEYESVIGSPYFLLTLVLGAGIWAAVVWVVL